MSTIHTPTEARIVGGDARKVVIEKSVIRANHPGMKTVRISLPRITALHGRYQEGKA